ncbi:MAG: hypothetical protein AMJ67_13820 [Betaproteobacteria bacterium SG8_41]|nr:MAG: hypothetical protein AMJ67_13820 [Betaproteobacteria bacterium SG8_41]
MAFLAIDAAFGERIGKEPLRADLSATVCTLVDLTAGHPRLRRLELAELGEVALVQRVVKLFLHAVDGFFTAVEPRAGPIEGLLVGGLWHRLADIVLHLLAEFSETLLDEGAL